MTYIITQPCIDTKDASLDGLIVQMPEKQI